MSDGNESDDDSTKSNPKEDKDAFEYVLKNVMSVDKSKDSKVRKAFDYMDIDSMSMVMYLTESVIDDMGYQGRKKGEKEDTLFALPWPDKILIQHIVKYGHYMKSQKSDGRITNDDWLAVTRKVFKRFRERTSEGKGSGLTTKQTSTIDTKSGEAIVTAANVDSFISSIKLDVNSFPSFDGSLPKWLSFKRKLISQGNIYGFNKIFQSEETFIKPEKGSQEERLYQKHNSYMFGVFTQKCAGGRPTIIIREHEPDKDARAVYLKMVNVYEAKGNMIMIVQNCYAKINDMKFNRNFSGNVDRYLSTFQNLYMDLDYASESPTRDSEKKAKLLTSIEDTSYHTIRDVLANDPNKSFDDCVASLTQHASMFGEKKQRYAPRNTGGDSRRSNATNQRQNRNSYGKSEQTYNRYRNNDTGYGRNRTYEEWQALSDDEKKKVLQFRRNKQNPVKGNNDRRNMNKSNSNKQREQGSNSDKEDTKRKDPSYREIMRSNVREASVVVVSKVAAETGSTVENVAIVDSGADTGILGGSFYIDEESTDRIVNVIGAIDSVMTSNGHKIGSGITKAQLEDESYVLLRYNEAVCIGKGKSLFSCNQMRAFGMNVNDVPKRYSGLQSITTTDGMMLPLSYDKGLCILSIERPSKEDLKKLEVIEITSPEPWDPSITQNDGVDEAYSNEISEWYTVNEPMVAEVYGNQTNKLKYTDTQIENIRRCLLWKSADIVKKTLDNTTQFATLYIRTPLRQHWKARYPGLNCKRWRETVATDTLFSSETGLNGETCAQLYVGKHSTFTYIFCMKTESQMADTLQDLIRECGAPNALFSDNAKSETSETVKDILRQYNIFDMQSEPHHPNQNPAERRIQFIKGTHDTVMRKTKSPGDIWYLCLIYIARVLNHISSKQLDWKTPVEIAFGVTPDISALIQFRWYQPVRYLAMGRDHKWVEATGRFVGVAPNVGDALTYHVLTDDTRKILARSVIAPIHKSIDSDVIEQTDTGIMEGGEEKPLINPDEPWVEPDPKDEYPKEDDKLPALVSNKVIDQDEPPDPILTSESDHLDPSKIRYPTVDIDKLMGYQFTHKGNDGDYKAIVKEHLEDEDKFVIALGDGERNEVITYNDLLDKYWKNESIDKQYDEHDGERSWTFEDIIGHRKVKGGSYEVNVLWDDGSQTWEPLRTMAKDDPITLAKYANDNDLIEKPGWKRLKHHVRQYPKKFIRLIKTIKGFASHLRENKIKFGITVPRNVKEAMIQDTINKNKLWREAIKTEMGQLIDYEVFKDLGPYHSTKVPDGYKVIRGNTVFDVKQDLRRKARYVAMGNLTDPPKESVYSSVVSIRSLRMVLFIAELTNLTLCACDIGNAYLEAKTKEKIAIIGGPEFQDFDLENHLLLIHKALYGLRTSGARFWELLSDYLREHGWFQSRADPDVWMKDEGDHYSYICRYVDDLIIAAKNAMEIIEQMKTRFILKGVGEPKYHLGGDFERRTEPEKVLTWGSKTYIDRCLERYQAMFGELPRKNTHSPLEEGDHPESDTSELCDNEQITQYQSLMGMLQWTVTLGRMDVMCAVMTMSRYRVAPRIGHLDRVKRMFGYLRTYKKTAIKFRTDKPDYSAFDENHVQQEWDYSQYGGVKEEIPKDAPEPRGPSILVTEYIDANLYHDEVTGRSCTGILAMLNKTPIDWYSKRQATVESATYGSEFLAGRIGIEQLIDIRYTLRMLGCNVDTPSYMFGDNMSVITQGNIPSSSLKKRHNAISYHRVREAVAMGIVRFHYVPSKENPADILTKYRSSRHWFPLMKPLIFWDNDDQEDNKNKGKKADDMRGVLSGDANCEAGITDRRAGVATVRSQMTRSTQGVDFSPLAWSSEKQLESLTGKPLASTLDSDWEETKSLDDPKVSPSGDVWDDLSERSTNGSSGEDEGVSVGDELSTDVGDFVITD